MNHIEFRERMLISSHSYVFGLSICVIHQLLVVFCYDQFMYGSVLYYRYPILYIWILLLVWGFHTLRMKLIMKQETLKLPLIRMPFSLR